MIKKYPTLFNNDVVLFRNGDRGIVIKDKIILQSGSMRFKQNYKYTNQAGGDYDIVKVYHSPEVDTACFNLADDPKYMIWTELKSFPKLENGDVVVLNNGNIYMKVDNTLVNQKCGYMNVSSYDINGECLDVHDDDDEWDIKKVYRNNWYTDKKYYVFDVIYFDDTLIWERC